MIVGIFFSNDVVLIRLQLGNKIADITVILLNMMQDCKYQWICEKYFMECPYRTWCYRWMMVHSNIWVVTNKEPPIKWDQG